MSGQSSTSEALARLAGHAVLVTGSSGFLGYPMAQRLAHAGCNVIGLDPIVPCERDVAFTPVIGDLEDVTRLQGILGQHRVEYVIHCGGVSGPMLAREDPLHVCRANVVGTIHLAEAARAVGVARFVFCSSAAALGDTGTDTVPEDAALRPKDLYGGTKGAGELVLRGYGAQYGLPVVALRIANAYGPRRRTRCAIKTMLENALAGEATNLGWGRGYRRPYLYLDDAVSAILLATAAPAVPRAVYNLGGPDYPSMDEIAAIVRELVPGARITLGEGIDALAYRRGPLDMSAAARELGYVARFPIRAGIAAYAAWLRSTGARDGS